ncbi:MAG: hypothetical protein BGO26_18690 [Actinobacteria bacterium 69-20]|nr:ribbon-helix-helix protein, CopG family [Actinomycetota bacterium]OJV24598.1 MAG: hypothetical protein BGO26_18690 [Actinobacteria bacterium 69-20]
MAKVMISLPDDVLGWLDREAAARATTRSGLIRELAEDARGERSRRRAEIMRQINAEGEGARGHGGNVAELVKANRPKWPKQ